MVTRYKCRASVCGITRQFQAISGSCFATLMAIGVCTALAQQPSSELNQTISDVGVSEEGESQDSNPLKPSSVMDKMAPLDAAPLILIVARHYKETGDFSNARTSLHGLLNILKYSEKHDSYYDAVVMDELANLHSRMGNYPESREYHEKSLQIVKKTKGPKSIEYAKLLTNAARNQISKKNYSSAETLYKQAEEILTTALSEKELGLAVFLSGRGSCYCLNGDYARAEKTLKRSIALTKRISGAEHLLYHVASCELARVYIRTGRLAEARPVIAKAKDKLREQLDDCPRRYMNVLAIESELMLRQSRLGEAETLLDESLSIAKRIYGKGHPEIVYFREQLVDIYELTNRHEKALQLRVRPDRPDRKTPVISP